MICLGSVAACDVGYNGKTYSLGTVYYSSDQ